MYHFRLYEKISEHSFWIHVQDAGDQFEGLVQIFEHEIRPVAVPLYLVSEIDDGLNHIDEAQDFFSDAWLQGKPLSIWEVNHLLQLTTFNMPVGRFCMAEHRNAWQFKVAEDLTEEQQNIVINGLKNLGYEGTVEFISSGAEAPLHSLDHRHNSPHAEPLPTASSVMPGLIRQLIERDEDLWRQSLCGNNEFFGKDIIDASVCACLFDAGVEGPIELAELLTLYDRVDIIPDRNDPRWLSRLKINREDLVQLVSMGRCRLVLPFSSGLCRTDVLEAVAEIDPGGVVLSRQLASRARFAVMQKDPLLYGTFSQTERAIVLQILGQVTSDPFYVAMLGSYAEIFERQHWQLAMHGAMSCAFSGIGSHLAEIHYRLHGKDARMEMGVAGAGMEWAMGLGATWIPRHFGGGYDETHNCHQLASFMGRTRAVVQDPVAPRMHLLADGLLALSNVPPLEVARNFDANAVRDFRALSQRMLREAVTYEEMEMAVQRINRETERFESRTERLAQWKIHSLIMGVAAKPFMDIFDAGISPYASIFVAWLADVLRSKLPPETKEKVMPMLKSMLGLALAPSVDAVVVSRSRELLKK